MIGESVQVNILITSLEQDLSSETLYILPYYAACKDKHSINTLGIRVLSSCAVICSSPAMRLIKIVFLMCCKIYEDF